MKIIPISGVIGWDVTGNQIRAALNEADGDEIEIQLSSVGGFVFDGLEIFNLIRNYKGKKSARIMGISASMGSYIPLSVKPEGRIIAEANAVGMIHNAWGGAMGQASDLRAEAAVLDGLSAILAEAYVKQTGKTSDEIHAAMDAETWFFGSELLDYGLVDEIVGQADPEKKEENVKAARLSLVNAKKLIAEYEGGDSVKRVAALVDLMRPKQIEQKGAVGASAEKAIKVKGHHMTLEELKAANPEAYQAAYAEGKAEGVKAERDRVRELSAWKDGHNADTVKVAEEAIAQGKTYAEVASELAAAASRGPKQQAGANPPAAATAESTASGADPTALTDEDREAAAMFNMSEADYKKFKEAK